MAYKNRKKKMLEYESKYSGIPKDYYKRLEWMYDKYEINDATARKIITERQRRMNNLYYTQIKIKYQSDLFVLSDQNLFSFKSKAIMTDPVYRYSLCQQFGIIVLLCDLI